MHLQMPSRSKGPAWQTCFSVQKFSVFIFVCFVYFVVLQILVLYVSIRVHLRSFAAPAWSRREKRAAFLRLTRTLEILRGSRSIDVLTPSKGSHRD